MAYVLGITRVDPIRHELLFERFINEGRTAYPDVDIDFSSERREEVIQYVYERYGAEHTGMVCNLVTYRARSAVREVGYALGFPRPLVDRVAKALETYDSVMVRRDLEAEGGFAQFFARPGEAGRRRVRRTGGSSRRRPSRAARSPGSAGSRTRWASSTTRAAGGSGGLARSTGTDGGRARTGSASWASGLVDGTGQWTRGCRSAARCRAWRPGSDAGGVRTRPAVRAVAGHATGRGGGRGPERARSGRRIAPATTRAARATRR